MIVRDQQGTAVAVLALILCPIPILGLLFSLVVQKRYSTGTNAHTCGMIGSVLGALFTFVAIALAFYIFWIWWAFSSWDL